MIQIETSHKRSVDGPAFEIVAAKAFIQEANRVREGKLNEAITRQTLIAGLADTFPPQKRPSWLIRHIKGAERYVQFAEDGKSRRGFVDSEVNGTAIEYEYDLRKRNSFGHGKHQVQQYCVGLLNRGEDAENIRGVLSDGVEWYAFKLVVRDQRTPGTYGVEDVELNEIERLSCTEATDLKAKQWVDFLVEYLGREGSLRLSAASVAEYLGFESAFGASQLKAFEKTIQKAMEEDTASANLVRQVWTSFVSCLNGATDTDAFEMQVYVQEFYLTILARLVCANVISRRALRSQSSELHRILNGRYFEEKGLHRLVEYDYFGWLTTAQHIHRIEPLAAALQSDLTAYGFDTVPNEDVFGELLAMLANRTQRVLLGQEWTPAWLAELMAHRMFDMLKPKDAPRFVDMCCGSGAMIVAVSRLARQQLERLGIVPGTEEGIDFLVQAATGFDIDPVAVVLAKVNWVVANRDWLEPFDGSKLVSLPIYHADSLFGLAPVFGDEPAQEGNTTSYRLQLLDEALDLPRFLVEPATQTLFDELLKRIDSFAHARATQAQPRQSQGLVNRLVSDAVAETSSSLDEAQRQQTIDFATKLVETLTDLQRRGMNGLWVFVIRNSYRPALLAGQFNGIISNPPWLALSKIRGNPFEKVLRERAERYGLRPNGSAFLHLDMATTFFAHAVDHFLAEDGAVACILPDTVRNGAQHDSFRSQLDRRPGVESRIRMALDELWTVDKGVFRNRAAILFGRKSIPSVTDQYEGCLVSAERKIPIVHYPAAFGARYVWSPNPANHGVPGGYPRGFASQGADIMPRRLVMVSARRASSERTTVTTPQRDSSHWYLLSDAKKHKGFSITSRTLPSRFIQACLISKHVAPFVVTEPASVVLPIERTLDSAWRPISDLELSISPSAKEHFRDVIEESDFSSLADFWEKLNWRQKLTKQMLTPDSWLVVYGAGGGIPAAAHVPVPEFGDTPPLIDQTLYWITTDNEDEALFLVGLINSDVLLERISDFIPEGDFGDRHLHTLPSKALPQFDPANEYHADVVSACRFLIQELNGHRNEIKTRALFTTEISMIVRRRRLRTLIRGLDAFEDYSLACQTMYDALLQD
ncbi:MAG: N-6 DNA methylase [Myxococcota bacterium]|nr:N-6 DNA methylase [Myxococcota bacterium]